MNTTKDNSNPINHVAQLSDMTLRDYFAAQAMQAAYSVYASDTLVAKHWTIMGLAESAYSMADAMLQARSA